MQLESVERPRKTAEATSRTVKFQLQQIPERDDNHNHNGYTSPGKACFNVRSTNLRACGMYFVVHNYRTVCRFQQEAVHTRT